MKRLIVYVLLTFVPFVPACGTPPEAMLTPGKAATVAEMQPCGSPAPIGQECVCDRDPHTGECWWHFEDTWGSEGKPKH